METGRMLLLSGLQAEQLACVCAAYRSYAWQWLEPSPERNQTMRAAQALQGRLSALNTGKTVQLAFVITEEERLAFRTIVSTLMHVYGAEPPSVERTQMLEDLYVLRVLTERRSQQTTAG